MRNVLALSVALAAVVLPACATPKPEPEIASSAAHGGYAKEYPDALQAVIKDFAARKDSARKGMAEFGNLPPHLKDADAKYALQIVERADEDGRQYAYVERLERVEAAGEFFETERDEINKKVAGAVAYTAKKADADTNIANAVPPSLKDAVDKQLEKELYDASEAQRLVDRYRPELGKETATALSQKADVVSRASYDVHIRMVEDKVRILRLVQEADLIKHTLDDTIAAERAFLAEKRGSDADKKAAEARIAELSKSKASVDGALQQANALVPTFDDEIRKIQREYDNAFDGLTRKLRDKVH
jgi:hypothetical protein